MGEKCQFFARMGWLSGISLTNFNVKESPHIVAHVLFRTRICEEKSIHS